MNAQPTVMVEQTDVLIADSGAAGMRAAIAAHDAGAKVVLLAKGPRNASHTRMSGGRYKVVTGLNPEDSNDAFFRDTIDSGAGINNHILARVLVDETMDRAYSGLRRVATAKGKAAVYTMLAIAWCAAVAVLGTLVLAVTGI